jgi:hypothetical protein
MALYLPVGSILKLNSNITLSEHNRQPVSISTNRIEKQQRMSNGSLRKYYIADKRSFSVSWVMLPSYSTFTVDGGYGALDLKAFYSGTANKGTGALSGQKTFDLLIKTGTSTETVEVVFSSFNLEVIKRNVKQKTSDTAQEFWNLSISMEEV